MRKIVVWMFVSILAVSLGCKGKSVKLDSSELLGSWNVIELKVAGSSVKMPDREPVLIFSDSNRISGFAGCNQFFGTYQVKDGKLQIQPGGMTMAFCPDMEFESLFMNTLATVSQARIYDSQLELSNPSGDTVLVFSAFQSVGVAEGENGCNKAAGYTWSDVKGECIRLFDSGIRLNPIIQDTTSAVFSAFLVFSPDSLQVELFLPNEQGHPILDRRELPDGTFAWNQLDDDTPNVRRIDGSWTVSRRGVLLYQEDKPIHAVYVGGDGKTRRLYQVEATFYPGDEKVVVQYDDQTFELPQQISGSGFRYEAGGVSLMGKGQEATLILGDSLTLTLTERE